MDKSLTSTPRQGRRRQHHWSQFLGSGISNTDKSKLRPVFLKTNIKPTFDVTDEYDIQELARDLVVDMWKADKRWKAMDDTAMDNSCPKFDAVTDYAEKLYRETKPSLPQMASVEQTPAKGSHTQNKRVAKQMFRDSQRDERTESEHSTQRAITPNFIQSTPRAKVQTLHNLHTFSVAIPDKGLDQDEDLKQFLGKIYQADLPSVKRFKAARDALHEHYLKGEALVDEYDKSMSSLLRPFLDVRLMDYNVSPKKVRDQHQ